MYPLQLGGTNLEAYSSRDASLKGAIREVIEARGIPYKDHTSSFCAFTMI